MRSQLVVQVEIFRLQIEQNAVIVELAHRRRMCQSWEEAMASSKHMRDHHRGYWDSESALGIQQRYRIEEGEIFEQYEENQKKLTDLADELAEIEKAKVF